MNHQQNTSGHGTKTLSAVLFAFMIMWGFAYASALIDDDLEDAIPSSEIAQAK